LTTVFFQAFTSVSMELHYEAHEDLIEQHNSGSRQCCIGLNYLVTKERYLKLKFLILNRTN